MVEVLKDRPLKTAQIGMIIFVFFLSLYILTASGRVETSDGHIMLAATKSIVENRTFAIPKDTPGVQGIDGKYYSKYGIGQSIVAIPWYIGGKFLASKVLPAKYAGYATMFAVSLFNAAVTALTCLLIFLFGQKLGYSTKVSIFLSLIYGLGTMAWPYAKEFFSEPLAGLFILFAVFSAYCHKIERSNTWLFLSGLAIGMAMATRLTAVILVPILGLYILLNILKEGEKQRLIGAALSFLFPIAIFFLFIGWYNLVRFGSFLESGYGIEGEGFTNPLFKGIYGLLLSPGKSLFLYNPILFLSFFGIASFFRNQKSEAILFLSIIVSNILLYSKWVQWYGGWCWGPRFLLPIIPFIIFPIGFFISQRKFGWVKIISIVLIAISVLVQILAVSVNNRRYYYEMFGRFPDTYENKMFYEVGFSPLIGQWKATKAVWANVRKGDFQRFSENRRLGQDINKMNAKQYVGYLLSTHLSLNSPNFWLFYLYLLGFPLVLIWVILSFLLLVTGASGVLLIRNTPHPSPLPQGERER